jgi:hypothetical protein
VFSQALWIPCAFPAATRDIARSVDGEMTRFARIAGIVGGAVLLVSATGTASAATLRPPSQSPSPSPSSAKTAYCKDFVNHLATDLKVDPATLRAQMANAGQQTLNDAVKNGDLTAKQADKIKARYSSGDICAGMHGAYHGAAHHTAHH